MEKYDYYYLKCRRIDRCRHLLFKHLSTLKTLTNKENFDMVRRIDGYIIKNIAYAYVYKRFFSIKIRLHPS